MITALHQIFGRKYTQPIPTDYFLAYDFNGNFNEKNGINNLVQNGTVTFTADRKGGNTAVQFGSGYLQTANNLPASSVWSISFWMKNNSNSVISVFGGESGVNNSQTFNFVMNDAGVNYYITIKGSNFNRWRTSDNLKDNIWHHYVFILDRTKLANEEIQVYVDGILSYVQKTTYQSDLNGNWGIFPLFIGQRGGSLYGFNGQMKFLKIFNYPLSTSEITNLYNKTM